MNNSTDSSPALIIFGEPRSQREGFGRSGAMVSSRQDASTSWAVAVLMVALFLVIHYRAPGHSIDLSWPNADDIASATTKGSILRETGLCVLGVFGILVLSTHRSSQLKGSGILGLSMFCYAAWSIATLLWADSLRLTLTRTAVMGAMVLGALALAEIASFQRLLLISIFTLAVRLTIDVVAEVASGAFQPFKAEYRFSGTLAPNHQAWNCALLLLSAVAATKKVSAWRIPAIILALLAALCLVLTGSRSAFMAVLIALACYWNVVSPKRWKIGVAATSLAIAFALLIAIDKRLVPEITRAALLGRSDDVGNLDGRYLVWTQCANFIGRRPFLGYGYNAFWTPEHVDEISEGAGWGVPGAHNGYLDLLLGVGVIGCLLYLLVLGSGIHRAVQFHRRSPTRVMAWCVAFLVFFAITMSAEEIASQATFVNLMFIAALTKLAFNPY